MRLLNEARKAHEEDCKKAAEEKAHILKLKADHAAERARDTQVMTEERIKLKEELIALKQQRTLAEREVEHQRALIVAENSKGAELRKRIEEKETEKLQEAKAMLESERQHLRKNVHPL